MYSPALKYILSYTLIVSMTVAGFPNNAKASGEASLLNVPVLTGLETSDSSIDQSLIDNLGGFTRYFDYFRNSIINSDDSIRAFLVDNPSIYMSARLYLPGTVKTNIGGGKSEKPEKKCDDRRITDPGNAHADEGGAWLKLVEVGYDDIPNNFSEVRVNDSASISCLLQEVVEQNKLALNLQIHQLLNQQIQAAQARAFAEKKQDMIISANINWVKQGNVRTTRDEEGNIISSESFPAIGDQTALANWEIETRAKNIANGILGQSNADEYGVQEDFDQYELAKIAIETAHEAQQGTKDVTVKSLTCNVTGSLESGGLGFKDFANFESFMAGGPAEYSGAYFDVVMAIRSNPSCTRLGAQVQVKASVLAEAEKIREQKEQDLLLGGGVPSIRRCKVDSPDCSETELVSTGGGVADTLKRSTESITKRLENVQNMSDLVNANESVDASLSLTQDGVNNFDTNSLSPVSVEDTVANFYEAIKNGYFDLQGGTTDWALGAMLQIYDHNVTDWEIVDPEASGVTDPFTATAP